MAIFNKQFRHLSRLFGIFTAFSGNVAVSSFHAQKKKFRKIGNAKQFPQNCLQGKGSFL